MTVKNTKKKGQMLVYKTKGKLTKKTYLTPGESVTLPTNATPVYNSYVARKKKYNTKFHKTHKFGFLES